MADLSNDLNTKFISENQKALANIKYTSNWLSKIFDEKFADHGISTQQYNILRILKGAKTPLNVSVVKNRMVEKSPNTTRLMDKLCSKNLILRSKDKHDKRSVFVQISEQGIALINAVSIDDDRLKLAVLSKEEIKVLNTLLDKIRV